MAYKTTITFPVQNISPTETIQLILEFDHDLTGSNRNWDAEDYNLKVLAYGKRELSYDLEEALTTPSSTNMVIGDPDKILDDLLFGLNAIALATDKQAKVTKKINGVELFIGNMIEDTISFDNTNCQLSFTAAPKTDILNKLMISDDEGVPTTWTTSNFTEGVWYKVTDIIDKLIHIINPSINSLPINFENYGIYVQQDWIFQGDFDISGFRVYNFNFWEIYVLSDLLFFNSSSASSNAGDALRQLAIEFGCFAGMVTNDKAFFKQLFSYNTDNVQIVDVLAHKKCYKYGLLDYIKISKALDPTYYTAGNYTVLENRVLIKTSTFFADPTGGNMFAAIQVGNRMRDAVYDIDGTLITVWPTEGAVYSYGTQTFELIGKFESLTSGMLVFRYTGGSSNPTSGTFTKVSGTGDASIDFTFRQNLVGDYLLKGARDPINVDNVHRAFGQTIANFWYATRGNMRNSRVDKFLLRGITYDFLKDFNYNGSKYQPISMVWNDADGTTECEAIYLGEL